MKKNILIIVLMSLFGFSNIEAQIKVTGTIKDKEGVPLIGVNVIEKGKANGAVSDFEGNYTITVASKESKLIFTYVGMTAQEIVVGDKTTINIVLKEDAVSLDEIVLIGFGQKQLKEEATGAVTKVDAGELQKVSTLDATNALTGRAPGVRVVQLSGEPGAFDTEIDIRGYSGYDEDGELTAQDPLFIIDGFESDKETFSRLDPNDIESMSVLKDGTAAIYGVEAANGVILVTTKRGKAGKTSINYSGKWGFNFVTRFPETVDGFGLATLVNEQIINNAISNGVTDWEQFLNANASNTSLFSDEELQALESGAQPSYNYLDLMLTDVTERQQHNLSFRGGSEDLKYFASVGYFHDSGIFSSGSVNASKLNGRLNLDFQISNNMTLQTSLGFTSVDRERPFANNDAILKSALRFAPFENPYADPEGNYLRDFTNSRLRYGGRALNPLGLVDSDISGYRLTEETGLNSRFRLQYKFPSIQGLRARASFAYDVRFIENNNRNKVFDQYTYNEATDSYDATFRSPGQVNSYEIRHQKNQSHQYELALLYNRTLGRHKLGGLLLGTARKQIRDVSRNRYVLPDNLIDVNQFSGNSLGNTSFFDRRRSGLVGRVNYGFANKYNLQYNFRYDGSSRYRTRWGFFQSVSGAWTISNENFMRRNLPFLTFLKLRASYGKLGDDSAAQDFNQLEGARYPSNDNRTGYYFGDGFTNGVDIQNAANPNLTWYISETYNFGVEGNLWKGLLSFEVDLFRRDRSGLLVRRRLGFPGTFGVRPPQENFAGDRNSGYEILLGHKGNIGKFRYYVNANMSYAIIEKRQQDDPVPSSSWNEYIRSRSNRYAGSVWGYETDGQFQNYEEIFSHAIIDGRGNRTLLPGDIKFRDLNGDGVINVYDRTIIALNQRKPNRYYGLEIGGRYKGFDFSMLFQGATNFKMRYPENLNRPFFAGSRAPITRFLDRWRRADPQDLSLDAEWIPGSVPATGDRQNYQSNSFWWNDVSYVRLKSMEIGFNFPESLRDNLNLSRLRLYLNGYNIFTLTNGLKFIDPELNSRNNGRNYPQTANFNLGLNIGF